MGQLKGDVLALNGNAPGSLYVICSVCFPLQPSRPTLSE